MKHVVVGTAGHIDHGKSALVLALTGTDPDRLKEEKARGITIDLGFARYEADGINYAFVDVPGHERFVKNMLAGVGGIDCVLLAVAADESVMPQTREHFDICRLLHVSCGLIVLTKADLADPDTLDLVRHDVQQLVADSFLDGAPVVAVSAKTGEGLDVLKTALGRVASGVITRASDGPARLPIDRVFSVRGFGTVVTGTLVSGQIAVDDELMVLPPGRRVKVRGIQVHGGKETHTQAGQRVAINLGGVDVTELTRGNTLAATESFETSQRLDAAIELLSTVRPLKHGARVRFHQGTAELLGRVALSFKRDGVQPGERTYVRIRLEQSAVVTRGDRFILRAYSPPATIGGGVVLDPQALRGGIRTRVAGERFARLDPDSATPATVLDRDQEAVVVMVEERGATGLPTQAVVSRAGLTSRQAAKAIDGLVTQGRVVRVGETLVAPGVLETMRNRLVAEIGEHHRVQPLSGGLPREEARERLFGRAYPQVFEHILAELTATKQIVARDRLALTTHRVLLSEEETRARETIERAFRQAGLMPPDTSALASGAGLSIGVVDRMVVLLLREKVIVRVGALLFHQEALGRLKRDVRALGATGGPQARIDVSTFKDRYGITRKFAIPLLEYLDRERVTRRTGVTRMIL